MLRSQQGFCGSQSGPVELSSSVGGSLVVGLNWKIKFKEGSCLFS